MKYFLAIMYLCAAVSVRSSAAEHDAAESASSDIGRRSLSSDGEFQKISAPLTHIFQFKIENGILTLDRAAWKEEAAAIEKENAAASDPNNLPPGMKPDTSQALRYQARLLEERARQLERHQHMGSAPPLCTLFQKIEATARMGSRSFSGGGPSFNSNGKWMEWQSAFEGKSLSGQLVSNNDEERLALQEKTEPNRTLDFVIYQRSGFRIQISNPEGELILLRQMPDGAFSVITMLASKVQKYEAETFEELVRLNRTALEADVLPALKQCGIVLIADSQK
jgi:hypothetical protein